LRSYGAIQSAAPSFGVELRAIDVHDEGEIERTITTFARTPNSGMILTASAFSLRHRSLIIKLSDRHKLPAAYFQRGFVADGGLVSYGPDTIDQHRRAANYVDRILKGDFQRGGDVRICGRFEHAAGAVYDPLIGQLATLAHHRQVPLDLRVPGLGLVDQAAHRRLVEHLTHSHRALLRNDVVEHGAAGLIFDLGGHRQLSLIPK
jgi:hypothetical protein